VLLGMGPVVVMTVLRNLYGLRSTGGAQRSRPHNGAARAAARGLCGRDKVNMKTGLLILRNSNEKAGFRGF